MVVGDPTVDGVVEGRLEVGLGAGRVDGIGEVHEAAVRGRVGGFRQTSVVQGLSRVDEGTLFREGEFIGTTQINGVPAIVAAGAGQGADLEVGVCGRAAAHHVLRRGVGHVGQAVIRRREGHEIGLKVLVRERDHVHGGRERQVRAVQQAGGAQLRLGAGNQIDRRGLDGHAIAGGRELRSGRGLFMRVLKVGLQVLELPVYHQVGILRYRLFESVTAGLQGRDISRSFRSVGRLLLVHRHGP